MSVTTPILLARCKADPNSQTTFILEMRDFYLVLRCLNAKRSSPYDSVFTFYLEAPSVLVSDISSKKCSRYSKHFTPHGESTNLNEFSFS